MRIRVKWLIHTIALIGVGGLVWADDAVEVASKPDLERGRAIFEEHCVECHGSGGRGDGPRAALLAPRPGNLVSAATSTKTDEELLQIIERGVPRTAMPGWEKKLSPDDMRHVLGFVRSLVHFREPSPTPSPP